MKFTLITIAIAIALSASACDASPPAERGPDVVAPVTTSAVAATPATLAAAPAAPKLQADLRALWHGHVVQTRDYAKAVKADNKTQANKAAEGVVANAKAISAAVASFHGPAAGQEMLRLLSGHWAGVKAMTDAQRRADKAGVNKALTGLIANAGKIATFLAGANPNLPEDAVRGLLVAHGAHHAAQIQQIMAADMTAEAGTWKAMQMHMDTIADALAGAIAKQFPDKTS